MHCTPYLSLDTLCHEFWVSFCDDATSVPSLTGGVFPSFALICSQGAACRELTEDLIKALGEVITTENTNEYYEDKVVNVQHVRPSDRLYFLYFLSMISFIEVFER